MNAATLPSLSAALLGSAGRVASAIAKAEDHKNPWAIFCAMGLQGDTPSLTLDAVGDALLTAINATLPKRAPRFASLAEAAKAEGRFRTLYGWYRELVRVHAANLLTELTGPNARPLTMVARGIGEAKKAAKPKVAKADKPVVDAGSADDGAGEGDGQAANRPNVAAPLTFADVRAFLVSARETMNVKQLATVEADLSVIVAEAGNLARMLETARKVAANAKANKAPRTRKAPVAKAA